MSGTNQSQQTLNHWLRLGIPCCLGALAGVFNYMAIDSKLTPTRFCVLTETVPAGGLIRGDAISSCDITGGGEFMKYAVPYAQVRGFLGSRATHRIEKNSLLLWQHFDHDAPYPIDSSEIEIAFASEHLDGVDLPDQLFTGDRLLLQVLQEGPSSKPKYYEMGPFTASKVAYVAGEEKNSIVDELRLIVKKRSRHYREIMSLKQGEEMQLVHIGRAS